MVQSKEKRLTRDDWLQAALSMCELGIENVKIAPLAEDMGVTTGSFYWHFKNRPELLDALLEYWEREMTDVAIKTAREYPGPPAERIFLLMEAVMHGDMARYDLPIWHWAQSDSNAAAVLKRVLKKRFNFAAWMFKQAGFSDRQAKARGRMMVVYLMGESTLVSDSLSKNKELLRLKHAILMSPEP